MKNSTFDSGIWRLEHRGNQRCKHDCTQSIAHNDGEEQGETDTLE